MTTEDIDIRETFNDTYLVTVEVSTEELIRAGLRGDPEETDMDSFLRYLYRAMQLKRREDYRFKRTPDPRRPEPTGDNVSDEDTCLPG